MVCRVDTEATHPKEKNHESKLLRNTLSNCTNSCPSILYLKEKEGREGKANIGSRKYLLKWLVQTSESR